MQGIKLLKEFNIEFNTLTVINNHNANYPNEIYTFLKSIGSTFHQYIPIIEQQVKEENNYPLQLVSPGYKGKTEITSWSVTPEQYGNFYIKIFDQWVRNDVGSIFVQMFDVVLANWVGEPCGLCTFDKTCGKAGVLEHNGDIYSCDHYVYPENKLGNILDTPLLTMMISEDQYSFGEGKHTRLPGYCLNCDYIDICNGECPKNRLSSISDGEKRLNFLCNGLKTFFKHVDPYMNFMANELKKSRPPANVMKWIANNNK